MENIINDLTSMIVPFAKNFILAIIVAIVGFKVSGFVVKKIKNGNKASTLDQSMLTFITSFISIALKIIVIVSVISIIGIPMSSIVALIASAGVAIGLAVQGALSNLVGGIMILLFRPFKVGDYIEANNASGTVREISVFYTILLTVDNKVITVPNGGLTNSVITNYSSEELRRVDIDVSADYNCEIYFVKTTMLNVVETCDKALKTPEPVAVINEFGQNAIKYSLRVWVKSEDYWDVRFELTEKVRNSFKDKNINIPYPQMDVHIKN